jgi:hypothetical protein
MGKEKKIDVEFTTRSADDRHFHTHTPKHGNVLVHDIRLVFGGVKKSWVVSTKGEMESKDGRCGGTHVRRLFS